MRVWPFPELLASVQPAGQPAIWFWTPVPTGPGLQATTGWGACKGRDNPGAFKCRRKLGPEHRPGAHVPHPPPCALSHLSTRLATSTCTRPSPRTHGHLPACLATSTLTATSQQWSWPSNRAGSKWLSSRRPSPCFTQTATAPSPCRSSAPSCGHWAQTPPKPSSGKWWVSWTVTAGALWASPSSWA